MNQITEALPRQEKFNVSGIGMKKNKENPKKSFEDILKRQNETDVSAALAGIGGEMVGSQVEPVLFQAVPEKLMGDRNCSEGLSSVSQIQKAAFVQKPFLDIRKTEGEPEEGKAVQNTGPENAVDTMKIFQDTAGPVMQADPENTIETIQTSFVKAHTEDSLKSVSTGEGIAGERAAVLKVGKTGGAKAADESPISGEEEGYTVQAFQQMNGPGDYVRETAQGEKGPPSLPENMQPDVQDLKYKIIDQIAAGKKEFQVQLKPENLGTLLVKASYDNGKAVISIICTESKTMHVMMQNAEELGNLIQSRLGGPTEVVVETPHTDYLEQQNQQQDSGQQKSGYRQEKKEGTAGEASEDFLQQLRLGLA